jgi:hypothetical protein
MSITGVLQICILMTNLFTAAAALGLAFITAWLAAETRGLRRETVEANSRTQNLTERQQRLDAYPAAELDYAIVTKDEITNPIVTMQRRNKPAHEEFIGFTITSAGRGAVILDRIDLSGRGEAIPLDEAHLPPGFRRYLPCRKLDQQVLRPAYDDGKDHVSGKLHYRDVLGNQYIHHFRAKLKHKTIVPLHVEFRESPRT